MGYRSQSGPRRGAGQRFQKSLHAKAKAKNRKHKGKSSFLEEHTVTSEEIAEKTLNSLKRLGEQKFAVSPFSQYFDDWLINLKDVLTELESTKAINTDESFVNECQRILTRTEQELCELKGEEGKLNQAVRELADNNHKLVEIDAEYAAKTREIGPRKNAEIQRLTLDVQNLETELERVRAMKTSIFKFSKKVKAQKEAETKQKLDSAKAKLESALETFKIEQEKLHDEYEKKKHTVIEQVQELEKEVEKLETDSSVTVRRDACEALVDAVKSLLERQPPPSSEPSA